MDMSPKVNPADRGNTRLRIRESVDSIEMQEDSQRQAILIAKIGSLGNQKQQ